MQTKWSKPPGAVRASCSMALLSHLPWEPEDALPSLDLLLIPKTGVLHQLWHSSNSSP